MKILVVGAGSIGGYFGGRLIEAGRDVTFLVRQRRAGELAKTGLVVKSPLGDISVAQPKLVTADKLTETFDLILLSCKANDLDSAMDSLAPAVGPQTAILPLLNGMRHIEALEERFAAQHVLGGQCMIATVLDEEGRIIHLNDLQNLSFGERDGSRSARVGAIAEAFAATSVNARLSEAIMQEMWEKWVFIASAASITSLMRSAVGDFVAAGGAPLALQLRDECSAIAAKNGHPPSEATLERARQMLTAPGSPMTTSMLRDITRGGPIEADQIVGDLLRRGGAGADHSPLLRVVYVNLKAYEVRREREGQVAKAA